MSKQTRDSSERFGNDVSRLIIFSKAASIDSKVDCLYPESFIIGILTMGENPVTTALSSVKLNLIKCLKDFKTKLKKKQQFNTFVPKAYTDIKLSKDVLNILSVVNSTLSKDGQIKVENIYLTILSLFPHIKTTFLENIEDKNNDEACLSSINKIKTPERKKTPVLEKFCRDMTAVAKENKFDPIMCRDNEIEEAITVLCRRTKSNPLLIGEPGVGKSAIVEGICQRIVNGTVPNKLQGYRIFDLNMTSMVSGTNLRGQFEERLQEIIKEVEEAGNVIVFIDELHTIVGAGSGGNSGMDASNILKPALARNFKCIGATTHVEYKKYFSDDGALMRRFGTIDVNEPNEKNTKIILHGIKGKLESFHNCVITDGAIDSAVSLSKRYRTDKFFPDKAIDCIDIACAKYSWNKNVEVPQITSDDVAMVISKQCSIPLEVVLSDTYERIKKTEDILKERVVGQDEAVNTVCRVLKNAYSGVRSPNKPIGIMVFGGPSGTGKTYLSKELARVAFGSESSFIRLDMSEYSEPHSVSRIVGSPPGYVGFKDMDVVVDKIKRKPYSVVLLDEIEKAHPTVLKLFLQIMADGKITSAMGEEVNCKQIIFIMTGNFGVAKMSEKKQLGFSHGVNEIEETPAEEIKKQIISYCESSYGHEFVNRVDSFIAFAPLSDENLEKITTLRLSEFSKRINNQNVTIDFAPTLSKKMVLLSKEEHGTNAMIIERIISKHIEPLIADELLKLKHKTNNGTILLDIVDDKIVAIPSIK